MTAMRLEVLYFGGLRPLLDGVRKEELRIEAPCDVSALVDRLCGLHPALGGVRPQVRVAVNEEFADPGKELHDGDRVALVPPVAGGEQPLVALSSEPLSYATMIEAVAGPEQGGICVFAGTVRLHNRGKQVTRLEYEAYPEMVTRQLDRIARLCEKEADGVRVAIAHREGTLAVGDVAVIVATSAPHRAAAFSACRKAIELLKQDVPIFKHEISTDGEEWIGLGS